MPNNGLRSLVNQLNYDNLKILPNSEKVSKSFNYNITTNKASNNKISFNNNVQKNQSNKKNIEAPLRTIFFTYFSYFILFVFGCFRDFLRKIGIETKKNAKDNNPQEFPRLYSEYESFYMRNMYLRARDCFNRPICSVPGATLSLIERVSKDFNWTFQSTNKIINTLNLSSYNYLGFAENNGKCAIDSIKTIKEYSVSSCSSRQEFGNLKLHKELENQIANYLSVESAVVFGMGFATNAANICCLVEKGCLILSDELNHSSLVLGSRLSSATIKTFKHNDVNDLEEKLKHSIINGQNITHRPWKKILIIVEGIYSMEGSIVNLPKIIELKKKYKAYLYLDEAHSIGALGKSGRGVTDYWNVRPDEIDVLMGTFTKSFGSCGGYIAGSRRLVNYIRINSHAHCYASSMSAPIAQQIISSLKILTNKNDLDDDNKGEKRINQLAWNSNYFREKLKKMGFIVYGSNDSPIVPLMIYLPAKACAFSHEMLKRGIAVVIVGFPATSITESRVRFCMSASHTKEMLDNALKEIDEVGNLLCLKYLAK